MALSADFGLQIRALQKRIEAMERAIAEGASSRYEIVAADGDYVQPRRALNFIGATVVDNTDLFTTDITAGGGSTDIPWTPTWNGNTTDPSLGDGTLSATAEASGNIVLCSLYLAMGTTTTFGTGGWSFTPPATIDGTFEPTYGVLHMEQSGETSVMGLVRADGEIVLGLQSGANVSATSPWTWDDTGGLFFSIVYRRSV